MLNVSTPKETTALIEKLFSHIHTAPERISASDALGRALSEDIISSENVPAFIRSTADGYAVHAADTFGCMADLPAVLRCTGAVQMGHPAQLKIESGQCAYIPTGGQLPEGTNAVVMVEHAESYGNGAIGILKAAAPGQNRIEEGADITAGKRLFEKGTVLKARHIGALMALGIMEINVSLPPIVGIISTGDELIPPTETPLPGQIRDVNTQLLCAATKEAGGKPVLYGICRDRPDEIQKRLADMAEQSDIALLSGGSSVGLMDATYDSIAALGSVYLHGIAIKPGKPTIMGGINGKPVFGLPGNPLAAYFIFRIFVRPLIYNMLGKRQQIVTPCIVTLESAVPSNHGREEYVLVKINKEGEALTASPIAGLSGLITKLSAADGYIRVPRECEGFAAGAEVSAQYF